MWLKPIKRLKKKKKKPEKANEFSYRLKVGMGDLDVLSRVSF